MKTLWISKQFAYTGAQLKPLYAYLNHRVQGDSMISWVGPCEVSFEEMIDGEDLIDQSLIQGAKMLHFIIEVFHQSLFSGVVMQRLFASICREYFWENHQISVTREGDDLYWKGGKLSISIASISQVSIMVHFAMNVTNEGTPVKTASLEDLQLNPEVVAKDLMTRFQAEFDSIVIATQKVKPLG